MWVKNTEGVAKKRQRKATVLMWVKNVQRSKAAQEKGEGQLTSSPTFSFWWKSNSWQFFISESSRRFNSFMASCPHTHSINRCNKLWLFHPISSELFSDFSWHELITIYREVGSEPSPIKQTCIYSHCNWPTPSFNFFNSPHFLFS